jgi:small subunit ribosomal protein S6
MIITPVLSEGDLKKTTEKYKKLLTDSGAELVHEENWGLKQLAYPIQKKTTGYYFLVEFNIDPLAIAKFEVELSRDELVMRFLTSKLDKYAIEYNEKKRKGLIGVKKQETETQSETEKTEA